MTVGELGESVGEVTLSPNDQWEREFPKTYQEALDKLSQASTAYSQLPFPEGDFRDTSRRSVADLIAKRSKVVQVPDSEHSFWENVEVPTGFEGWALEKMGRAHRLWTAHAMRDIYKARRMTERERAGLETLDDSSQREKDDAQMSEATDVMMGNFRVEIKEGKPIMKVTNYGQLLVEAAELAEKRHQDWVKGHEGRLISKFPKLSRLLEATNTLREIVVGPNLENMFLAYYFAYMRRKLYPKQKY